MTRNGKIARLPQDIREELNQRILNGQATRSLLDWLHEDERVWDMLEEHDFDPITDGNISEWKAGGYQCWLENKEARGLVLEMAMKSQDLGEATPEANMGLCVGNLLMVEFIKMAKVLVQKEEDVEKRWGQLEKVNRELARLRWSNARDVWAGIQQKRSDWAGEDREEAREKRHAKWVKKQRLAEFRARPAVAIMAMDAKKENWEAAWYLAAREVEIAQDLPRGFLDREPKGGFWFWDKEEEKWAWQAKKEESAQPAPADVKEEPAKPAKKAKLPKSKGKTPKKVRAIPASKKNPEELDVEAKDGGEKSETPHVVCYQEKENGSPVVSPHHESTQSPENEAQPGVIPTNSDHFEGGETEAKDPSTKIQTPEKHQTSSAKEDGKELGNIHHPVERKGDGSSVASPHHDEVKVTANEAVPKVRHSNNPLPGLWKQGRF